MEETDTIITLIGTRLAKVGNEFIFRGGAKECEPCKFNKTCLSLNQGSKYRIVNLRNAARLECYLHDSGVCAVEVIEAPIKIALESRKAIPGSKVSYEPLNCNYPDCDNFVLCRPPGIKHGEKFIITDVEDDIDEPCNKNYQLKIVEIKRQ